MKKFSAIILSIMMLCLIIVPTACSDKQDTDAKNQEGYSEYVKSLLNGKNSGIVSTSLANNEKALKYYKSNLKKSGDFMITDIEGGVCINQYLGNDYNVTIPEKLDEKSVIMLGGYLYDDSNSSSEIFGAFSNANLDSITIKVPSSVKYIDSSLMFHYSGMVDSYLIDNSKTYYTFEVDKDNPYFSSEGGCLYSKDMKTLNYINFNYYVKDNNEKTEFKVNDTVENFDLVENIPSDLFVCFEFGKNIKEINANIDYGEDGNKPNKELAEKSGLSVKGYKGTAAEKWADEQYLNFIAIE